MNKFLYKFQNNINYDSTVNNEDVDDPVSVCENNSAIGSSESLATSSAVSKNSCIKSEPHTIKNKMVRNVQPRIDESLLNVKAFEGNKFI